MNQFISDLRDPLDLYAALRPLLLICFSCGILPFKVVGTPGDRHLVVTIFGVANSVIHLVWFCTCYWLGVVNQQSLVSYFINSKVSRFGENLQIMSSFIAIGFTLILCFLKRDRLRKLLHTLTQIDKQLIHLGANINYKNILRVVWVALVFQWLVKLTFIGSTFILLRNFENPPDFFEWIFFFLPFAIISMLKTKYVFLMRLIRNRFGYINLTLKNLQMSENDKQMNRIPLQGILNEIKINIFGEITCDVEKLNGSIDSKRDKYDIIAELCRTHENLCDACYLVEQYFSHQMLTTITIEFVVSLFNFYFMFNMAFHKNILPGIHIAEFIAYFTFYTTLTMGTLYGVLRSAQSVTKEVCSSEFLHNLLRQKRP